MNAQEFLQKFADPDPAYSPAPGWWWSGEKLDIDRLRWQLDQLAAMGIHGVVVINLAPNGTLFGSDGDDPQFLSEQWWKIFEQVCDHARSIGTSVWFYDQIGFSGARYQADIATAHPECLAMQLRSVVAEGDGALRVECPAPGTVLAAYVVPIDRPDDVRYVPFEGRSASVSVDAPSKLRLVYTVNQGYDVFSPTACDYLLDAVHRQFQRRLPGHFGKTIIGSFQDELSELPTWGENFADTFAAKHGFRLESVIHRLFEPGDSEERRTRTHFHAHRADLAEAAFFKPFFQWHEENSLRCSYDQQSPAREARVLGCTSKYADYIQTQRWYQLPGCDLHGNGKLHSSIAWMYDRHRVWLEGFHSTGWGGTIADTFDWLLPYLRAGSNFYNPHAVYYSTVKGWWEWAPPSTCWRQPYAMHYRPFADMIARLTKLLSSGILHATIGVLFPTTTVQSALGPQQHFPDADAADRTLHEVIGSMRWHQVKLGPLDEMALDFHLLDEPTIQRAQISNGELEFRSVRMHTIILPHVTFLHDAAADQLVAFAKAGGRIIAVGSDEVETHDGRKLNISSLPNAKFITSATELKSILQDAKRLIGAPVPTLYRRDGDMHILLVPAVNGMATVVKWDHWFAPIEHTTIVPERYNASADLVLPPSAKSVLRFDPWTGSTQLLATTASPNGRALKLDFEGSPFAVLVWSDQAGEFPPVKDRATAVRRVSLSDQWVCEYIPTLPEKYADIHDANEPELRWPHTSDFSWYRGEGNDDWAKGLPESLKVETVRASFGVRGWAIEADGAQQPIVYSPKFGILQDGLHINTLGPKGHVPEEFIDLGKRTRGQSVTLRTGIVSDQPRQVMLAVGANAEKSAVVNGQQLHAPTADYFWMVTADLKAGENPIELNLTAVRDGTIRLFWCLVQPDRMADFGRPERIAWPEAAVFGSAIKFQRTFKLAEPIVSGQLKVSIAAMCEVFLDGKSIGRQGGFDPYRPMMRGQMYQLPRMDAGEHQLCVAVLEPGTGAPLLADLRGVTTSDKEFLLISDSQWSVSRDDGMPQSARVFERQEPGGPAWWLYRRPHPLPQANWLEKPGKRDVVLDLPLLPPSAVSVVQWLQWTAPPGATQMRVPLTEHVDARLWINGKSKEISRDGDVVLDDDSQRPATTAVLRITSRQLSGGLLKGSVTYRFSSGILKNGSWLNYGLRSYSGAIRLRQKFASPIAAGQRVILDLGRVRGTVEAIVNGRSAGIACLSPYRFDLTKHVAGGDNELELIVTNTLGNHVSTWSATRWWSPDQLESGVFGPVELLV